MANESTMQRIEMLKDVGARNLILIGEEMGLMRQCAHELASAWLDTAIEDLPFHPDYKEIGADDGSIRSEQAAVILKMASFKSVSDKSVCVVTDADTMTIELQNKLLKVLEDGEKSLAVIFITRSPLLDTVSSRCMAIEFKKTSIGEMAASADYNCLPILLACDGSPELYKRIVDDAWFSEYLEEFFKALCKIHEREQLKYILRLTHALKEKDNEYLPEKLGGWQMQAFLCMVKMLFWHVLIKKYGIELPCYIKIGNLADLYEAKEAELIYRKAEEAVNRNRKKGAFNKNDFFELLMHMIPVS